MMRVFDFESQQKLGRRNPRRLAKFLTFSCRFREPERKPPQINWKQILNRIKQGSPERRVSECHDLSPGSIRRTSPKLTGNLSCEIQRGRFEISSSSFSKGADHGSGAMFSFQSPYQDGLDSDEEP